MDEEFYTPTQPVTGARFKRSEVAASKPCVCGDSTLDHKFTGCEKCGCARFRTPADDLATVQMMARRLANALHHILDGDAVLADGMVEAREALYAYYELNTPL